MSLRRILDPHRFLGPRRVLNPPRALAPLRLLGPHRVLGLHRVLDPVFPVCRKEYTQSVFSRNHPALCFSLRRDGWQMPNNSYIIKLTKTAGGVLQKDCSQKYRNIYKKTLMLESLFHKVTDLQTCNFIKKRLQHRCFLLRNSSKTLLLNIICVELWTDFTKWLFVVLFQNHLTQ